MVEVQHKRNIVELLGEMKWKKAIAETSSGGKHLSFAVDTGSQGKANVCPCCAWDDAAVALDAAKDGDPVQVRGYLKHRSYTAADGSRKWATEVNVLDGGPFGTEGVDCA